MTKKIKLIILSIFPMLSEMIALLFLPSEIPVHYNMTFQVTEYGSKYTLLILGVIVLLFGLFMNWMYKVSVNKGYENVIYRLSLIALLIFNVINFFWLLGSVRSNKESVSVSIIGGADGPTVIFLAGKLDGSLVLGSIACVLLIAGVVVFIFRKKKQ